MKQPEINELVSLLNDYEKEKLLQLRKEYPEYKEMLELGVTLGEKDSDSEEEIRELKFRADVCSKGLKIILYECNELKSKIKSKLKVFNTLQILSQILILITGTVLISFINNSNYSTIKIIAIILTLISSVVTLIIKYLSGNITPHSKNLYLIYEDLIKEHINAEHSISEIKILKQFDNDKAINRLSEIIKVGNTASFKLKTFIEKYG